MLMKMTQKREREREMMMIKYGKIDRVMSL